MGVDCTILPTFLIGLEFFRKGRGENSRNRRQKGRDTDMLGVVKKKHSPMQPAGNAREAAGSGSWKMGGQPLEGSEQRSD